ncbi:MAG: preprotein translocase subunit SecE [Candidatus Pacebacteria bacterium]|nr:preprotein translocase subunit SecE [Candidatus Paceibacterota bacterium]
MISNPVKIKLKPKIKIKRTLKKIFGFLKEVTQEMKKIDWMSPKQAIKYVVIVILASAVIAIFLGGIDYIFTVFLNKFIIGM